MNIQIALEALHTIRSALSILDDASQKLLCHFGYVYPFSHTVTWSLAGEARSVDMVLVVTKKRRCLASTVIRRKEAHKRRSRPQSFINLRPRDRSSHCCLERIACETRPITAHSLQMADVGLASRTK